MVDDEVRDESEELDEHEGSDDIEIPEGEIHAEEGEEKEEDFAATSSSFNDEIGEDEEDPHEAAFSPAKVIDDSQLDPYGVGAPSGFNEEDDEEDLFEDDEEYSDDTNAF